MTRFKRTVAILLSAAMMFSLVGCNKNDDKTTTEATSNATTEAMADATTEAAEEEEEELALFDGQEVFFMGFDEGKIEGFTSYVNGGASTLCNENDELKVSIEKVGDLDYSNQAYRDGFVMYKNCVYTFEFDAHADIERTIQWRIQINGGDYHPYAIGDVVITPEGTHVSGEFTMQDESDPAPRMCFNMGMFEGMTDTPHNVYIDNIKLTVKDCSKAQKIEAIPTPIATKVNQLGYKPDDVKTVVVNELKEEKFTVINTETNEEVYQGQFGEVAFSMGAGEVARKGDFTAVKEPGTYKVVGELSGDSYEFVIGEGIYDDVYRDVVLMLYNQRCGCKLDESISGDFAHDECHMGDAIVYDDQSQTKEVTGGWHDAGDYGRYVVPGAKTIQDLFLAYEDFDCNFDDLGIPESGNSIPDLLDEAKYELDWMLKMQADNGGVYHKVTCLVFPETVVATEETDQLYLAPISYSATCDFAAVMAKASVLYKEFDEEFANTCLEAAKAAYEYQATCEKRVGYTNPEEIVTGAYDDAKLIDENFWAATELYLATEDDKYKADIDTLLEESLNTGLGWADIGAYAFYDIANSDVEGLGDLKEQAKGKIIAVADEIIENADEDGYFAALGSNYPWGSNMLIANDGMMLLMANKLAADAKYVEYATKQADYLFGMNTLGFSYVTGYGDFAPKSTHHRPSQVLEKAMPGMLVGGPNGNLGDPYAKAVLYGYSAAKCYVDNEQSFSCNEITIYWNSPLIYLLSGINK